MTEDMYSELHDGTPYSISHARWVDPALILYSRPYPACVLKSGDIALVCLQQHRAW